MNKLQVTHISLDDFLKLDLHAYEHRRHYYNDKGQKVSYEDTKILVPTQIIDGVEVKEHYVAKPGYYSKVCWEEVSLNTIVKENIEYFKDTEPLKNIVIAIHRDATADEIDEIEKHIPKQDLATGACLTESRLLEIIEIQQRYFEAYLDKWLTPNGLQTYLFGCDVGKLYSTRDYFESREEYFKIKKNETKAIYYISLQ